MNGLLVAANGQPELAGVFSTYAADTPQIYLDIDRDKAQVLGIKISDIFNALQSTLGSFYVNDFNVFGRTWQVNVQAETPVPQPTEDINRIYVRNAKVGMVPMRALAEAKLVQGPQTVVRYNGFRGAVINGAPKPGYSSGQALAAMERISQRHCRQAIATNGPGPRSRRRQRAADLPAFSAWLFSSPICFSLRFTKAGTFPSPLFCRLAWRYWAPSSQWS